MSYKIKKKQKTKNYQYRPNNLTGYPLSSKKHKFIIQNTEVKNILIMDKTIASKLVAKKVTAKYERLLKTLTELLVSDDDTGACYREALNLIEKFRLEIKNKYRCYLNEKELKIMANKLKRMQSVALQKEIELKSYIPEEYIGKSR